MPEPSEPVDTPKDPTSGKDSESSVGLAPGVLLTASDLLEDPNFKGTIVLLCRHDDDGAYGLVLNRPSHMPLREVFENPPLFEDGAAPRRVHIGGPVQPEELQVVELGEAPAPESVALASGVHVGGRWDSLESMLVRPAPSLRLFLGYAGWGPGQLEDEVAEGAWDVWSVDLRRLLETPEELWATSPEALRRFLTKEERGA